MENDEELKNKVIQYWDTELNKYKEIVAPGMMQLIEEERAPYKKQLDFLYDAYMFQNYLLDHQDELLGKNVNKTISLFFIRAASDLFALRQCLMVGQLVTAATIERNIFQTYVDNKLVLADDTEERCKLYEEYQHVLLWNRINTHKKYLAELELDPNVLAEKRNSEKEYFNNLYKNFEIKQIEENYEKVKGNYHPRYPYNWAWKIFKGELKDKKKLTLEFICRKLGIYDDYLHVYATSSLAVHNQPFVANFMTRKDGITSVPIFNDTINSIAGISASFVIEIFILLLKYSNSEKFEEIEFYLNHIYKKTYIDNR